MNEEDKIKFETGELSIKELKGIMKVLNVDVTFVDVNEETKFFSDPNKIFPRDKDILNTSIMNCHPKKIIPEVERLIEDLKSKRIRKSEYHMEVKGKLISVKYLGVYDENDEYIGVVELSEDHSEALKYFSK